MEDIINSAIELGKLIQKDERYLELQKAREASDADEGLQALIQDFDDKRTELVGLSNEKNKDQAAIDALNGEVKALYGEIMANEHMKRFSIFKNEIDSLMNHVNRILMASVNGEDPETVEASSCGSGCAGCSGCH